MRLNDHGEREVPLAELNERLTRYRLRSQQAEQQVARSLQHYGQLAPVVVCVSRQDLVLIDGFKRLRAARQLKGFERLRARQLDVDEAGAKAAIYRLNQLGGRPQQLEEAWIVHALVRDDGLSQVDTARLLGRHKSWVSRRLALLEQLTPEALDQLRLGLLSVSLARQLVRLPVGNQNEALQAASDASLTSVELRGVVDLLQASSSEEQRQAVLQDPRAALRRSDSRYVHVWDPRLSAAGNRAARLLGQLLDGLARMDSWLRYRGRADLADCDRRVLTDGFERLADETRRVAEAAVDFSTELRLP